MGDQGAIIFRFSALSQHPTAESEAITVTLQRPDGTRFGQYTSPDPSLSRSVEVVNGLTVTTWVFEMPSPFDQGNLRRPWRIRVESTAGIAAAAESPHFVRPQVVPTA